MKTLKNLFLLGLLIFSVTSLFSQTYGVIVGDGTGLTTTLSTTKNVGIGNAPSSGEKLDVYGAINIGNSASTDAGTIRWTGSDFEGYDGSSWDSFTTGPWTVFGNNIYRTTGLVGVGTSTLQAQLCVQTLSSGITTLRLANYNGRAVNMLLHSNGNSYICGDKSVRGGGNIYFRTDDGTTISDNIIFTSVGRVGIGTLSPAKALDVVGSVQVSGNIYGGTTDDNLAIYAATSANDGSTINLYSDDEATTPGQIKILAGSSGSIEFWTGGYPGGSQKMILANNGKFGVGTSSPTEYLDVNGNARFRSVGSGAYANDVCLTSTGVLTTSCSDERLKTDVKDYSMTLEKLLQLRPVSFVWKADEEKRTDIGFIAQEVSEIFPEITYTNQVDGFMGINYTRFTTILVKSVQEQHGIISDQSLQIDELEYQVEEMEAEIEKLQNALNSAGILLNETGTSKLQQNHPNPFNESTEIKYSLSNDIQSAEIMIFDMNGTNLKTYKVDISENGKLTINANELKPGMYIYSLITDGKEVGTRRMIITE